MLFDFSKHPSGAKAHIDEEGLNVRAKARTLQKHTELRLSAGCEVVPFQNELIEVLRQVLKPVPFRTRRKPTFSEAVKKSATFAD